MNRPEALRILEAADPAAAREFRGLPGREYEVLLNHRDRFGRLEISFVPAPADAAPRRVGLRWLGGAWKEAWELRGARSLVRVSRVEGGRRESKIRRLKFGPGISSRTGLDRTLAQLHRLHPLRELWSEAGILTLIPAEPIPWPLFVRLDFAKPFFELAGAPCLGPHAVCAVSLGRELMEATLR